MVQVSLEEGYSLMTLALAITAVLGATWWFYGRVALDIARRTWWCLLSLRGLAATLILLLFFRPILTLPTGSHEKRAVIFIVDTSGSMSATDDTSNTSRLDRLRPKLAEWWPKLQGMRRAGPRAVWTGVGPHRHLFGPGSNIGGPGAAAPGLGVWVAVHTSARCGVDTPYRPCRATKHPHHRTVLLVRRGTTC